VDLKGIDLTVLKRYANAQAVKDLDRFLDGVPGNVGYNAFISAIIAWMIAAGAIFFASTELEKVSRVHADIMQTEALQPPIPILKNVPVPQNILKPLAEKIAATYKGITMTVSGDGNVVITAKDTDYFPQFLASISYLQRGGKNWKTKISALCVGRACSGSKMTATMNVETIRLGEPEKKKEESASSPDKK